MANVLDQKTVVALLALAAMLALVFTHQVPGADVADFIKWLAGAYVGASALESGLAKAGAARGLGSSAVTEGTPAHAALMRVLGSKPAPAAKPPSA